jgi:hypothetical protein
LARRRAKLLGFGTTTHSDLDNKGGWVMNNLKTIIVLVVVVAIAAGGLVYLLTRDSGGKTDIIVNVEDIKKIAQLATIEYHLSVFVHEEKERAKYEWLKADYYVFMVGKVTGAVDLNQAKIEVSHDPKNRMVKITFKKGAVLVKDPELGEHAITMVKCADPNVFHKISAADWQKATEDARVKLKQTAIDDGIMNKTADEAKVVLTTFLQSLGYASQIEFEDK